MVDFRQPEINFAVRAVSEACLLVHRIQKELVVPTLTKSDRSPVTIADFASQALVSHYLYESFPNAVLVAEEDASELRSGETAELLEKIHWYVQEFIPQASPQDVCNLIDLGAQSPDNRFWTLDPIDGTKGFLRHDQYAVALALIENGIVRIGLLGCPNLTGSHWSGAGSGGSLIIAVEGEGAWACPIDNHDQLTRLKTSEEDSLSNALLLRSFESGHTNSDNIENFIRRTGSQKPPVLLDSQAKYALLAAGEGDLLLRLLSKEQPNYREKIWDQAAGSIILREAGGRITDLHGRELDFSCGRTLDKNRGILASNKILHSAALEILLSIGI